MSDARVQWYSFEGVDTEVLVDSSGKFYATVKDQILKAASLPLLTAKIRNELRGVKVEVELCRVGTSYAPDDRENRYAKVVVTGVHANRNLLVKNRWNETQQTHRTDLCRPFTEEEKNQLDKLIADQEHAEAKVENFIQARRVDPYAELKKAREAKGAEEEKDQPVAAPVPASRGRRVRR